MTARLALAVFLCLICLRAARAEGGLLPNGHLDTNAVSEAYLRADIPFVRSALEGYLRNHPKDVSTAEKVFTHLYLGAAYAGDPEGRGKSEAHFRAALKFAPDADPAGLYLPPAALDWFESLRTEVRTAARPTNPAVIPGTSPSPTRPSGIASAQATPSATPNVSPSSGVPSSPGGPPATGAAPAPALAADKPRGWIWWAVGGGAALAAGAGAFAWMETRSASPPQHVQVDATLK